MRAHRTITRFAAALLFAGSMAAAGVASAANSWGLPDEVEARFDAKVTDVLCVLSGDCPEDCGAGNRLLGLLQDDGTLVLPLKNAGPFTGPDRRSHPLLQPAGDGGRPVHDQLRHHHLRGAVRAARGRQVAGRQRVRPPVGCKERGLEAKDKKARRWMRNDEQILELIEEQGVLGLKSEGITP